MNRLTRGLSTGILTVVLLVVTLSAIAVDCWMTAHARDEQVQSEKAQRASDEAGALVQAIEQYWPV